MVSLEAGEEAMPMAYNESRRKRKKNKEEENIQS